MHAYAGSIENATTVYTHTSLIICTTIQYSLKISCRSQTIDSVLGTPVGGRLRELEDEPADLALREDL